MLISNSPKNVCANLIIVMGVSGSGKSTLAQKLAEYYGYTYLDGDDFHSATARQHMSRGLPLTDKMRAPWVSSIKKHLEGAAARQEHTVLAFSGLKKAHRNQLRDLKMQTVFIFLQGEPHLIEARMANRKNHFMPTSLLKSQLESLEDPSQEPQVITLNINAPIDQLVASAVTQLHEFYTEPSTSAVR